MLESRDVSVVESFMLVRHFVVFDRIRQERPASPVHSCLSMKSDRSMDVPFKFSDGGPSNEEGYVLTSAGVQCSVIKVTWCEEAICTDTQHSYIHILSNCSVYT